MGLVGFQAAVDIGVRFGLNAVLCLRRSQGTGLLVFRVLVLSEVGIAAS
jgi:hypothetical protein